MRELSPKCILILSSKLGYQFRGFAQAARETGADVLIASDRCKSLDDPWRDGAVPVKFHDAMKAAEQLVTVARERPVCGILALGDRPAETAALVAARLGITYNSFESVANCRSKLRQREVLRAAGLPVPGFFSFRLADELSEVLRRVEFPCVVKPHKLFASQGVIRTNTPEEFTAAVKRIAAVLASPEVRQLRESEMDRLLVENYIPGGEVAVEGLLTRGQLRVLAIFDKPDPLEGPYFEETIYVTPSRLPGDVQARIIACLEAAVRTLGLTHGPLHAEFRIREDEPWVLEVQPRPIGGLCSRALRFIKTKARDNAETQRALRSAARKPISLEELLVRHALNLEGSDLPREEQASGVMMIPVPQSGILEGVSGVEDAAATPQVDEVQITARLHDYIAAWPDGSTYLGFIFARGAEPVDVEAALRAAHAKLRFTLAPRLPVEHPVTKCVS